MYKIENIIKTANNECIKYTHYFNGGVYKYSEKEAFNEKEVGLCVCVSKVPRTVDKWSYMTADCIGEIMEIYYFYETESSSPRKKYLIKFPQGDMFCDDYKEVIN